MKVCEQNGNVYITDLPSETFNIKETLECGQCFRWRENNDGSYTGVALGVPLTIERQGYDICLYDTTLDIYNNVWQHYFDLDRDYDTIKISLAENDEILRTAISEANGLRILNQDFTETLISFIISASNNIPRIKKIIESFCSLYGDTLNYRGETLHAFPTLERLQTLTITDLAPIKAGFRDKYIIDGIAKLTSGEVTQSEVDAISYNDAKTLLKTIYGVGDKVADCVLFFGAAKSDAFPVDTWIKKIMEVCYFNAKPQSNTKIARFARDKFGSYSGFAQQYLFVYARNHHELFTD